MLLPEPEPARATETPPISPPAIAPATPTVRTSIVAAEVVVTDTSAVAVTIEETIPACTVLLTSFFAPAPPNATLTAASAPMFALSAVPPASAVISAPSRTSRPPPFRCTMNVLPVGSRTSQRFDCGLGGS